MTCLPSTVLLEGGHDLGENQMGVWRNPGRMSGPPSPHVWTPPFTLVLVVFHRLPDEEDHFPRVILFGLRASISTSALSPKYQTQ